MAGADRDPDAIRRACTRFVTAWSVPTPPDRDRYGEGGAVERLEQRIAELLGKEAAAFFPSGTMAQQIALRIHCDRVGRRTVAFHPQAHLEVHEEKGYSYLHGLSARLVGERDRLITLEALENIAEPIGALLLELPQRDLGGQLPPWDDLVAQVDWARAHGAALHLDGARLWQCGPFYEKPFAEISALFDTVYVSLYKDLGGLAGCVLAGPEDIVAEARVWRVRHGGRLATVDTYALAGLRGLDEVLPRMPELVAKARELGEALADVDGVRVAHDPPQVAMLHAYVAGELERVREAALDIAEETSTLIAGGFAPTPLPTLQRTEIAVGTPTLEVPTTEIAELYGELVRRAAA
jgi:threonine aldolase